MSEQTEDKPARSRRSRPAPDPIVPPPTQPQPPARGEPKVAIKLNERAKEAQACAALYQQAHTLCVNLADTVGDMIARGMPVPPELTRIYQILEGD